jgi:hypothetical protein
VEGGGRRECGVDGADWDPKGAESVGCKGREGESLVGANAKQFVIGIMFRRATWIVVQC